MRKFIRSFLTVSPDKWQERGSLLVLYLGLAHYAPVYMSAFLFFLSLLFGLVAYVIASVWQGVAARRAERNRRPPCSSSS